MKPVKCRGEEQCLQRLGEETVGTVPLLDDSHTGELGRE